MNRTVRSVATSLAVGFAMYFAARGVWWIEQPSAPLLMVAAIALYLVVVNVAILWDSAISVRMPLWAALATLVSSILIPVLVTLSLDPLTRTAPFATWYIGALGLMGVVCIVRRRFVIGWLVVAVLVATSSAYLGFFVALSLGLVGSLMWVVIAHLLVIFWDRAVRDTERLAGIQQAVSAWHATQQVRQKERRLRTQFALAVAGPVLSRTVASRGSLTDEERLQARLAEGASATSFAALICSTMRCGMRSRTRVAGVPWSRSSMRAAWPMSTRRDARRSATSSLACCAMPMRSGGSSVRLRILSLP